MFLEEEKEEKHNALMIWQTEEDIGSKRRKLKIEKRGNESLWNEKRGEIHVIFHKSMDLLTRNICNDNNNNNTNNSSDNNNNNNNINNNNNNNNNNNVYLCTEYQSFCISLWIKL